MAQQGKNNRDTLVLVYRLSFSLGAFLFTLATLTTLPSTDQQIFNPLFKMLIKLSACCMIVAQICELIGKVVPKCRFIVFAGTLGGNISFMAAANEYNVFNKGELFLIAAFLISLAYQFKILFIVLQSRNIKDVLMRYRNKFIRCVFVTLGQILFLAGSVMLLTDTNQLVQKTVTGLGGVFISLPIFIGFQRNASSGYAKFKYSMEVPTIV